MHQQPHPTDTPTHQPYGTPDTPHLTVRGEARLEVDPDIARLRITVTARGTDRRTTLEDLTRRNQHTLELLKSYGQAIEKLATSGFTLTPQLTQKGRNERIRAYHGTVHTTAVVTDFTILGELTTRLADQDLTHVDGPWWALRATSPAHREVRQKAVREAVRRAREYAEALDARLVALTELTDNQADTPTGFGRPGGARMRGPAGGAAPDTPPALDLEPQRQTVHAHVNARFTITRPEL
ncbi:SIMPL domain-containing protein [Streptomyces sp. XD-27]|uniref:SIMPL domain-containing protein n=1 Tax=Streptomyces sp. XD-27 TaxID=3062779 RepID=UPI0026F43838|nr:SIMPL domain-containing protein [Streptomyces sp. XD-27]WKX69770.1 SIMPL domain-containing protein [Streptomyces sp. XD-27]